MFFLTMGSVQRGYILYPTYLINSHSMQLSVDYVHDLRKQESVVNLQALNTPSVSTFKG